MSARVAEVRLPSRLVEKIDGYARKVKASTGVAATRAQAVVALIERGLRAGAEHHMVGGDPLARLFMQPTFIKEAPYGAKVDNSGSKKK